ncbi:MAG: hypothetical protein KGJ66_12920 [Alphaproteobacteria bacterium]|nr:hypothetical protein [Alphaproteobacteria bacterium]
MTRRRTAKPPLYPGKLNEPLGPSDEPISLPPGEFEWRPEFDERFELLFEHFSISNDDAERWKKLSLALAKNHVPGFQEKQPETRGRPSKWALTDEFVIWYEFDILVKKGKTERQAVRILTERHPDIKDSQSALLIRLKRFDKRLTAQTQQWWKHKRR